MLTEQTRAQHSRLSPRLLAGLLACHLLWLTGCETTFSPRSLARYTETVKTVEVEPAGEPEIQLTPHSDGLGWTAHVLVTERVHQDVVVQEVWEGKQLKIPFHPIVVELFGLFCPFGLVSGMVGTVLSPDPGQPSWVRGYEMCAGGPTHEGLITKIHDEHTLTDRVLYRRTPQPEGTLQLQWQRPNRDPLVVDVPLQPGPDGTVVRLPWLADALIRNGQPLDGTMQGEGHIVFDGPNGLRGISPLRITADTLRAARSQMVWRAPDPSWPRLLQIRLALPQTRRTGTSLSIPVGLITQRLLARQIQVVAREEAFVQIMETQRQQLTPAYRDTAPSMGRMTAATVLLQIGIVELPQRWQVTATAVAVQSGQVLGTLRLEDRRDRWEDLMNSLASLLPDLLAPDATRREGWFIP